MAPVAKSLEKAVLRTKPKEGKEIHGSDLWDQGPVLVVCLRRPGCLLCRHNALEIWKSHEQFESLGVRLVCILHEWIDREVDAFAPEYWGGELYLDEDKAFNAAIHGGKVAKGNLFDMMNPFSRAWKNLRRVKAAGVVKDSNLVGDGLTLGGVMLVAKGGEVIFTFPEATFGDAPSLTDLIEAAKTAANKS